MWKFQLDDVIGPVHTIQKVTILPFGTINCRPIPVLGNTACRFMSSWNQYMVPSGSGTYIYLWGTTSWLLKSTSLPVQLECPCCGSTQKAVVGQVVPANQVPLVVHPTRTAEETNNQASKGWVLEALNLPSLTEWPGS